MHAGSSTESQFQLHQLGQLWCVYAQLIQDYDSGLLGKHLFYCKYLLIFFIILILYLNIYVCVCVCGRKNEIELN